MRADGIRGIGHELLPCSPSDLRKIKIEIAEVSAAFDWKLLLRLAFRGKALHFRRRRLGTGRLPARC